MPYDRAIHFIVLTFRIWKQAGKLPSTWILTGYYMGMELQVSRETWLCREGARWHQVALVAMGQLC